MAKRARKYCRAYPCGGMAVEGSSYCKEHQPPPAPKLVDNFYVSVAWRRYRNWFITNNPLCKKCESHGLTVLADVVDHRLPLKDGGEPFDEDNTQSLCHSCHNRKTAEERKKRGIIVYSY